MQPLTTRHITIFFCLLLLSLSGLIHAQETMPIPQAPQVPVRGYILMDFHSGAILAEMDSDTRMEPASITKLMSAYVIYKSLAEGSLQLSDQVTISEKAWRTEGSRMFVEVGKKVPVDDLIMGMVVQSGNDATVALAEHIAGTESAFAAIMNQQAARLGLTNTHFVNSTGLPHPDHYTTARDIAILVRAVIRDFPVEYRRYSIRDFTYNNITQHNRNRLLWQDDSVDGLKTGHTSSAGYCLAASALRGDMRLISVVLGADNEKDRFRASQALLNYGFRFFETHKLYGANEPLTEARIWKGEVDKLPLGLAEDLYVTIPRGQHQDMNASLRVNNGIEAPVSQGAPFGKVTVTLREASVAEAPLVALRGVAEGGLVSRLVDQTMMFFNSWFE